MQYKLNIKPEAHADIQELTGITPAKSIKKQ